ncbi:hypothetical protein OQA88_3973 [Cercophora sp. LCS_1]
MDDTDYKNVRLRGGSVEGIFSPPRVGRGHWRKPVDDKVLYGKIPKDFRESTVVPEGGAYEEKPTPNLIKTQIALVGFEESRVQPATKAPLVSTQFGVKNWFRVNFWLQLSRLLQSRRKQELAAIIDGAKEGKGWKPTHIRPSIRKPRPNEFDASWYTDMFTHLFVVVDSFSGGYFGHGNFKEFVKYGAPPPTATPALPASPEGTPAVETPATATRINRRSPWSRAGFSQQFIHYASLVAKQDAHCGGWDVLLTSNVHRTYLVIGIIGRVLQNTVFDELLFGANEDQIKMLKVADESTPDIDGFKTNKVRAEQVRDILGARTVPDNFWLSVDKVTIQLVKILLPLLELMDDEFPKQSRERDLRKFYQEIHNIVAEAALLSIFIRWSRDIFRFDWPTLGLAWAVEQENYDSEFFKKSYNENYKLRAEAIKRVEKKLADEAARAGQPPTWWAKKRGELAKRRANAVKWLEESNWSPYYRLAPFFALVLALAFTLLSPVLKFFTFVFGYLAPGEAYKDPMDALTKDKIDEAWCHPDFLNKVQIVLWPALYRHSPSDRESKKPTGVTITAVRRSLCIYHCGRIDPVGQWEEQGGDLLTEWTGKKRMEARFTKLGAQVIRFIQIVVRTIVGFIVRYTPPTFFALGLSKLLDLLGAPFFGYLPDQAWYIFVWACEHAIHLSLDALYHSLMAAGYTVDVALLLWNLIVWHQAVCVYSWLLDEPLPSFDTDFGRVANVATTGWEVFLDWARSVWVEVRNPE